MALSGSFNTNSCEGRYYTFSWSATQNQSTNKSKISWSLTAAGYQGWVAERTVNLVAAGATRYYKTDRVERTPGQFASGSFEITHNSSGDASFSASLQVAVYYSEITATGSGSWSLNRINRGIVYIYTGGQWVAHQCYVYNGGWVQYAPYVYNGGWVLY